MKISEKFKYKHELVNFKKYYFNYLKYITTVLITDM